MQDQKECVVTDARTFFDSQLYLIKFLVWELVT
jgi:hypothetical protein